MSIFRPPYEENKKAAAQAGAQIYTERLIAEHNKAAKKKGVVVFAKDRETQKSNSATSSTETPVDDYDFSAEIWDEDKAKQWRKAKWKATPERQKTAIVLQNIGAWIALLFSTYGVYKLPDVLFSFFSWPIEIARILSFIFFCFSVLWISESIPLPKYQYQKQQCEIYKRIGEIRAQVIEQAVWDFDISPLLKICDPEFIKKAESESIRWKDKSHYSGRD